MKIEIICPLYNAENYIIDLHRRICAQKDIEIIKINYILTESNDNTEQILRENNIDYIKIEGFSHYLTREKALMNVSTDYAIMLTQDVIIEDELCFIKMVKFVGENNLAGCYVKQISKKGLDRYYRQISYGENNYIYDKNSLITKGLDACFFSDACSCYNVSVFAEIGGYGNNDFPTNEDMYYAYKCLINGYLIGYCADTYVIHSHNYSLKQTYNRYKTIGQFFKLNKDINNLKSSKKKYFKVIFKAIKRFDILSLIKFPFDVIVRMIGLRKGKK